MADLKILRDLRERVRKATGPDRELDARIWAEFDNRDVVINPTQLMTARARIAPHDECMLMFDGKLLPRPPVTGSIDAAIDLIAFVLPGWHGSVSFGDDRPRASVSKISPLRPMPVIGKAATPALSMIEALLSALISIEESKQGEGENV